MYRFDRDTALRPTGPDHFTGHIDTGWWIIDGPNGGYLAAILLRAAIEAAGEGRTPVGLTVTYPQRPAEGPIEVTTRIERAGRSVATVTVRAEQEGRLVGLALAALSKPRTGLEFCDLVMPDVASPEECMSHEPAAGPQVPMRERYEMRWVLGDPPYTGAPRAETGGWIRTEDARPVDHLLVTAFADAWVPPVFSRLDAPTVRVPTVELTIHYLAPLPRGDDPWCLVSFRSEVAANGFLEEDGEVWSRDGLLLARVRQVAAQIQDA